jgi:tripartite-type tricarboxylate transporter receptor subunit TctC
MTWIGTPTGTTDLCLVWHTSKIATLDDLQQNELILGGEGSGTTSNANIMQRLTGGKIRNVIGYSGGGSSLVLAMERGEIDGRCGLSWEAIKANYPDMITKKTIRVLLQFNYKRHPELPDVPAVGEIAKTEIDRKAMDIILLPQVAGYPIYGPPGLLPQTQIMLRKAFMDLMADEKFIADAKSIKLDLMPTLGEELQAVIQNAYASPVEVIERARELVR